MILRRMINAENVGKIYGKFKMSNALFLASIIFVFWQFFGG